ncbi:zeta toxin family protein [Kitasatospora sp. NPDC088783]|uniref:zeta toxin family protein n=1 Tax=Kitasatospora sp. NPDC088783 TaxID=3364077 RepID=UPI00382536E3
MHLSGDDLKALHPDYAMLLLQDPRRAGELVRHDYTLRMRQTQDPVRAHRADAMVEVAPSRAADLLALAAAFHACGYHVVLQVLAVREADSLQGTAQRYADNQRAGVPARFTAPEGHRAVFDGVDQAVRAAVTHPALDALHIVDRAGRDLRLQGRDGGSYPIAALALERLRPYLGARPPSSSPGTPRWWTRCRSTPTNCGAPRPWPGS